MKFKAKLYSKVLYYCVAVAEILNNSQELK